ncbi:MAG: PKD domain-containing protein, partial [Verrucomicrobiae bacterium]|nr:PKD domain-containing protein [Verrucomicrobiae bacterium]
MKRRLAPVLPLLLLALLVWKHRDGGETKDTGATASVQTAADTDPIAEFQAWLDERDPAAFSAEEIAAAIPLAEARRAQMVEWIRTDPRKAIEHAVSWSEYRALPEELRTHFERPFNTTGSLEIVPNCGGGGNLSRIEIDGTSYSAALYGKRLGQGTKNVTPLHGIVLDRHAAVAETVLETLSPEDAAVHVSTPLGNPDASRDFATGEPIGENPVTALAGGKRYLFQNSATIDETNAKLAELDVAPGPHGGSQLVFEAAKTLDGGSGIEWPPIVQQNTELASAWTETDKDVFFIRIDFPDLTGAEASQATLDAVLDGPVADSLDEISYGKTTIVASVSSAVIRMPANSSTYLSDYDALHDDAVAAYKAIYGQTSLSSYDIIGVHFKEIGFSWAGLASVGGTRQWIEGNTSSGVIIHEFGHNYGLRHASSWVVNNGTVVGAGALDNYGDPFDIMGDGPDPEGHFHMQGKSSLNWIEASQWVDANASGSGTRRIYRIDDPATTGTTRAVRVDKGASDHYWIGYRKAIPGNPYLPNGAYILWKMASEPRAVLLDMTPDTALNDDDFIDSALSVGRTYSDNAAGVHITPTGTGGSGADAWIDVNVQLGSFPGNQPPSTTLDLPAAADARSAVVLSVDASDPNGDPLAYFWDFGDGTVSTNSPTVSHAWATGGSYTVSVTVSDMKGGITTDTALMVVSDPLATWHSRSSGTTKPLYDITVANGQALAVGERTWALSNDGTTWTSGSLASNAYIRAVVHDGSQFVACGYDYNGSSFVGTVYTSPNGMSWTRRLLSGEYLYDIAYGNGVYIAVGDGGTMWRSTNGTSWSPVATGVTQDLPGVTFGNGIFMVVGRDDTNWYGIVHTSPDGVNWTDTTPTTGLEYFQSFRHVQYCVDRFLASGWNASIQHSTDNGVTFALAQPVERLTPGFAHGNGVYLAAGTNQSDGTDINLISTDGESWTPLTTASQDNRNAAVFFNNTFVTVGSNGSIWQSAAFTAPPEGFAAWQALHFPGSPPLSGPTDDFDHDGVPNLGEYATGTDPKDGGSRADLGAAIDTGYFTITVPKAAGVADVSIVVEHSINLSAWSTAGTTVLEDGATQLVV